VAEVPVERDGGEGQRAGGQAEPEPGARLAAAAEAPEGDPAGLRGDDDERRVELQPGDAA
jgi:hypothetical protein